MRIILLAASLTDASVAQRLDADISATQQMDQRMIGSLNAADDASSDSQEACPARIQVCGVMLFLFVSACALDSCYYLLETELAAP